MLQAGFSSRRFYNGAAFIEGASELEHFLVLTSKIYNFLKYACTNFFFGCAKKGIIRVPLIFVHFAHFYKFFVTACIII